jgi:PAS domain S-box-containing protein
MDTLRPNSTDLQQLANSLIAQASSCRAAQDGQNAEDGAETALRNAISRSIRTEVGARLSVILEGIGESFYALDESRRFAHINRAAEAYFGIPREKMLGQIIWDMFPSSAGTEVRQRYEQVFLSGRPASFEMQAVSSPNRYVEFHLFPYEGGLGVSFRDWTEQRRAEEILRDSQAQLSALADDLPLGMVYQTNDAIGFDSRRFLYISASCERLNGVPAESALDDPHLLFNLILPEHREEVFAEQLESNRERRPFDMEFAIRHGTTGETRWQRIVDAPRQLPNGAVVWDGIQIDITEHKRAEEHLQLLVNELNHRVKNTLAIVQSLATQSFRKRSSNEGGDFPAAKDAFEARLFALARGHDVLTRENWESASLGEIVSEALAAYRNRQDGSEAFETDGADLRVTPSMALSLSMALHELCTNALKYGALGAPAGRVRVSWKTVAGAPENRLAMRWEESGGPPVSSPAHKGFGTRLIEGGLARELNGTVRLAYEPTGVVCAIDVPLP